MMDALIRTIRIYYNIVVWSNSIIKLYSNTLFDLFVT